ncbi:PH domain-containing protein [Halocatena halophila]|uniref:PH domain-containing protein n=1 Tax=Halocatena halophila TaxID=2814576 RepID=UPI002ED469ED
MNNIETILPNQHNETVQWLGHPRRMRITGPAIAGVALIALSSLGLIIQLRDIVTIPQGAILIAVVGIVLGLAIPIWNYVVLLNTQFIITDKAVYSKRGVFSTRVDRISHRMIQNSTLIQGRLGRLLNYGSIRVDTAGVAGALTFSDIRHPREILDRIESIQGIEHTEPEIPGTIEEWTAIAEEVRQLRVAIEAD